MVLESLAVLLLSQAPAHLIDPAPETFTQCEALNAPTSDLGGGVAECDGRYYLDGRLAGDGSEQGLAAAKALAAKVRSGRFRSTEGYGNARWGMSSREVRHLYPKARAERDGLIVKEMFEGRPATTHFQFVQGRLVAVRVELATAPAVGQTGDAYQAIKSKLERTYGETASDSWQTAKSRIELSVTNDAHAVGLRLEFESRELAFLAQPATASAGE